MPTRFQNSLSCAGSRKPSNKRSNDQNAPHGPLLCSFLICFLEGRFPRIASDFRWCGGLILVRELDERLGLEKLIEEYFVCASFKDSFEKLPSRTLFGPNRISLR